MMPRKILVGVGEDVLQCWVRRIVCGAECLPDSIDPEHKHQFQMVAEEMREVAEDDSVKRSVAGMDYDFAELQELFTMLRNAVHDDLRRNYETRYILKELDELEALALSQRRWRHRQRGQQSLIDTDVIECEKCHKGVKP